MDYLNSSAMYSNAFILLLQVFPGNFVGKNPLREFEIGQYVSARLPEPGVPKKKNGKP